MGSKNARPLRFPTERGACRASRQALAKWPPNPRAYLVRARAAPVVGTLLGPALAEARILSAMPRLP